MRKIWKNILAIGCAATLAVGITACDFDDDKITAYDIAVKHGFTGTEEQWLQSLRGTNGNDGADLTAQSLYESAQALGYPGTFLDFCKEMNVTIAEKNDVEQISENMTSIVSIYCGYSTTKKYGNWYNSYTETSYDAQAGSGVIVELNKETGYAKIITNYHVIYNLASDEKGILENIYVYPFGAYNGFYIDESTGEMGDRKGEKADGVKATYLGGAMDYDIAVLEISNSEYLRTAPVTAARLGNSSEVTVGEEVYAIGNPAGAGIAVTNGILSVDSENIGISALDGRDEDGDKEIDAVSYRVMRTSAAINGGNSGGGLFNTEGELIGIVNAKSSGTTTDNMGYALPITQVKAVYDNILDNGRQQVEQAMLGVMVALESSKAVMKSDGTVTVCEEFNVVSVAGEDSAANGKLTAGDIFLSASVNGGERVTFTRRYQLTEVLLTVRKGDTLSLTVRNKSGKEVTVDILFDKPEYFKIYS